MRYIMIALFLMMTLPLSAVEIKEQRGLASWYGASHQGRPTASGEPFDKDKFTAAHRTIKFGTIMRVTNLLNNKETDVRINDRGPSDKYPDRIIDVSEAAAISLGFKGAGLVKVKIRRVDDIR